MDGITERINLVLQTENIKKADLARALHVSSAAVAHLCSGATKPSRQSVRLLCDTFEINETWLLTGIGEMKAPLDREAEIARITARLLSSDDKFVVDLTRVICDLSDEQLLCIKQIAIKLANLDAPTETEIIKK